MEKSMTQVKFTIETEIVSAFKGRCVDEGVSMTQEIRRFMIYCRPAKTFKTKLTTRSLRKKSVADILFKLQDILDGESDYRDKIPEMFEQRYETADQTCEWLAEAITCLESAY